MTTLAETDVAPPRARIDAVLRSPWAWCVCAVAYFVIFGLGAEISKLAKDFGDTDDATRVLQVRRYLAGAGWYDMAIDRFGGGTPLISHWSRLIDVPLAALSRLFSLFVAPAHAEFLMRAVWPPLVLLALLRVLVVEAEARAGRRGAAIAIALGVTALTGLVQYVPGRIDHHNVMIVFTVGGLLLLARSLEAPERGATAGVLLGLGLVIGYEPLALVAPATALAALAAVLHRPWLATLRNVAQAMTATLAAGVIVSQPPAQWLTPACDAIGLNLVAIAAAGAAGLSLLHIYGAAWRLPVRLIVLAACATVGVIAYVGLNPECLAGPYGEINPEAKRRWLTNVFETLPITATLKHYTIAGLTFLAFSALALAAAVHRARTLKTSEAVATLVLLIVAFVSAILQMKFIGYATFIAVVCLAIVIATFEGSDAVSPRAAMMTGVLLTNQVVITWLMAAIVAQSHRFTGNTDANTVDAKEACRQIPSMAALNTLPKGRFLSKEDNGPYIAATTHHDALSAPYHRISDAIAAGYHIFGSEPAAAESRLRGAGITYVALCFDTAADAKKPDATAKPGSDTLEQRLIRGDSIAYLDKVPLPDAAKYLHVWKLRQPAR